MKAIDYAGFPARQGKGQAGRQAARHRGLLLHRGLRHRALESGRQPGRGVGLWESAEVRVNPVGTIEILTGSHSHGQGHETTFAQLVAERLGIPISQVRSSTATPTRCSSAGHLRLALRRRSV